MVEYAKPLPIADAESQIFWDGCKEGKLLAQRCKQCGRFRWPPSAVCPDCYSRDSEWQPLSGRGHIHTFVVAHRAFHKGFADEVPYVIVHVRLDGTDDNVTMISNLIGVPWEQVKVGMPVEVFFEKATDDYTIPKFRLA